MENLKIREFQTAIVNFVNGSDLPIEVKRLCLEEIIQQVRDGANQQLQIEIRQRDDAEKAALEDRKENADGQTVSED